MTLGGRGLGEGGGKAYRGGEALPEAVSLLLDRSY